jgi:hypothetical protein
LRKRIFPKGVNMKLLDYLNDKFPVNGSWSVEQLINEFMTSFGVGVKTDDHVDGKHLFIFKYDMLAAKWQHDVSHECRGIILRNSVEGWEIISRPFNKFFNQHEGHCRIFHPDVFASECGNLSFAEKADGTCIQVYFDKFKNVWCISTLGSITTMSLHDTGVTFDTLFRRVIGEDFFNKLIKGQTYILELCTKLNRVVTRYPKDIVYLLGIRASTGELLSRSEIESEYVNSFSEIANLTLPQFGHFADIGINTLDEAKKYVESKTGDSSFGEYPEGFVVYDNYGPLCKMKNANYIALHHSLSDAACTRKAVVAAFFKGNMDDLYAALPEEFQKAADRLRDWLADFKVYLNSQVAHSFKSQPFNTRKDYALYVQALPERERMFQSFFFSNQDKVCDPDANLGDDFSEWIQKNSEKFDDYWKKVCYEV